MVKIIYRMAVVSDASQLAKLRLLMQCEVNSIPLSQANNDFESIAQDYFETSLGEQKYFSAVAEIDGKLIAANGLVIYKKPPSLVGYSGLVGYVTNVYTLPEFRNRGIAKELMNMLVQLSKDKKIVKLHLGSTSSGKKLYESVGFKPVTFDALELKIK